MKRVLLIDADILVYQTACAAEVPIDWGGGLWTLHSDMGAAACDIESRIANIRNALSGDELIFALTSTEMNFRKELFPAYKSNRKAVRRPVVWKPLREYLYECYPVFERPGLEGDDCLGIIATRPVVTDVERVLVSIDKDFKTIPGKHYNMSKPDEGVYEISETEADYFFMLQTLTGDAADGYPGLPGTGPKKAAKILEPENNLKDWWTVVLAAYNKEGLSNAVALSQAQCARILRASDYDFKNKKPIPWRLR